MPYFNPHCFRKTLVQLAMTLGLNPEQFKAWSQNLGHEQVMTTFTGYGAVGRQRQSDIMRALGRGSEAHTNDLMRRLAEVLTREVGAELDRARRTAD